MLPRFAVEGSTEMPGSPAKTPLTVTLKSGEYVQFTQDIELSGSPIQSNKPVALFGASSCLNVPVDAAACDTAHGKSPRYPRSAMNTSACGTGTARRRKRPSRSGSWAR